MPINEEKVDLIYQVEEKYNEEIKLGLGWDGCKKVNFYSSLVFNNFAFRNIMKSKYWKPFPMGDGQKLTLHIETNIKSNHIFRIHFKEPWLDDIKYSSLSSGFRYEIFYNKKKNKRCNTIGINFDKGKKLTWPDDYFFHYFGLDYAYYKFKNYDFFENEKHESGKVYNLNFNSTILRNNTDYVLYPTVGTELNLLFKTTLPYTLFNIDNFQWIEYQKAMFDFSHYYNIIDKLVLNTKFHGGILGNIFSPSSYLGDFENFYIGGTMGNLTFNRPNLGGDYITLRGYDEDAINSKGGILYQKISVALRYPIKKIPIPAYMVFFTEAGNSWHNYIDYNILDWYVGSGFGIRLYLPMIGHIGLDWGYGFQNSKDKKFKFHFNIGKTIR